MTINGNESLGYDAIGHAYLRDVERSDSWSNLYERPFLLEIFGSASPSNVLDLGAGTGFYTRHFESLGSRVIAADRSGLMLKYIRERSGGNVRVVEVDLESGLGFVESDSQDLVVASLVFHYLSEWDAVISDIHRVLVPQGKLLISMHHPFTDFLDAKRPDYHHASQVNDVWGQGREKYRVQYYSTSLQQIFARLLGRGLRLTRLLEPPIPGGQTGKRLQVTDADRLKPGLLVLEFIRD